MGVSLLQGGRGGRRRGRRRALMSEINVTPMVDVMLVLLIVFMVAAPLLTVGVPIDLPQTQAKEMSPERKSVTITVTPEGEIFLAKEPITLDALIAGVQAEAPDGQNDRVYVRGDASADYGLVMKVMGALSGAGYAR